MKDKGRIEYRPRSGQWVVIFYTQPTAGRRHLGGEYHLSSHATHEEAVKALQEAVVAAR